MAAKTRGRKSTQAEEAPPAEVVEPAAPPPVLPLTSLRAPFVQEGSVVRVGDAAILRHVGNMTLVISSVRRQLTSAQDEIFDDMLFELRGMERPLLRVDSMAEFFDPNSQFRKLVDASTQKVAELNQSLGLGLTEEEVASLSTYRRAKAKVYAFFQELGDYKLATKRRGEEPLSVEGPDVRNGTYSLGLGEAKKIWTRAFRVWAAGATTASKSLTVKRGYDRERVTVGPEYISIGCQNVSRWQAEQLALSQGWLQL